MKTCRCCKADKLLSDFCKDRTEKDGLNTICRTCAKEKHRIFCSIPKNKTKRLASAARYRTRPEYAAQRLKYNSDHRIRDRKIQYDRKRNYGLTVQQINLMIANQENKCAICYMEFANGKFHVDHDHKTSKVREFLCHHCNSSLGLVKESILILENMIAYIKKHGGNE